MKMEESMELLSSNDCDVEYNHDLDPARCDVSQLRDQLLSLKCFKTERIVSNRIQSILIHPFITKPVIFIGDTRGNFGVWDPLRGNKDDVKVYEPHRGPLNCITTCREDNSKLYTTSHDGTMAMADFNKSEFVNIYATDFNEAITHLTWHEELDSHSFLVAHGCGDVRIIDTRAGKQAQQCINCFQRSVRTVQLHPLQNQYFLASSGTGSCKIFDLRTNKCMAENEHPKGLTSAFFSHSGNYILSTCNDDVLRVFDSRILDYNMPVVASYPHNNHVGRWLTVFKATWVPCRDDAFFIGSLLQSRRTQFYRADGKGLLLNMVDPNVTTVCSSIAMHPSLSFLAGANSSGKVHLFGPPSTD